MDYNTNRDKLIMPEYGRHIQKMIEHVKEIPDREKRNEQIRSVVSIMGILNPQLKDQPDARRKFWDHVHVIAGFDIDVDAPFPAPAVEDFSSAPQPVPISKEPLKAAHYGRNIQNMVNVLADLPDDEIRDQMIKSMAVYMRQQYLIWNKDTVSEETIFKDIEKLSGGKLVVPAHIHLENISEKEKFNKPGIMAQNTNNGQPRQQFRKAGQKKANKHKWKK